MSVLNQYPLWTAIVTPFHPDFSVDYKSFEKVLRAQEAANNAVIVLGSTGESLALSEDERKDVVNFALGLKLRIPLFAGIPGAEWAGTERWIRFAQDAGIAGFLSVVPFYSKPGPRGQVDWFRRVLDTSTKPVMIYNVPGRSATSLHSSVLKELRDHPNFWALKESSGSTTAFAEFAANAGKVRLYCGDDALMPDFAKLGAQGLISVAGNVWPAATRLYTERCLQNAHTGLMPMWKESSDALFRASNPIPAKALLQSQGLIAHALTRPPLAAADLESRAELENADKRIAAWLEANR